MGHRITRLLGERAWRAAGHACAALVCLALAALSPDAGGRALAAEGPPRLVLAISVDQYSASLFDAWRHRYSEGLGRLAGGVVYTAGFQTHAGTETCPGHSTLLTGKHPNKTGIISNTLRDEGSGRMVYCVSDPTVVLAHDPTAPPVGPGRLMATTLGDWLKAASPKSRVVAVSAKDRAAITMAGHHPDGVFWLVGGVGFTTFMAPGGDARAALAPVAALNRSIAKVWAARPSWTYAHEDCRALAADWTINGKAWRSILPPENFGVSDDPKVIAANVMASPMADELTAEAAIDLLDTFRLGQGPAPDLLAVSFSATDFVGHRYGSRGPEMCEQMHRLDEAVGRLLRAVDRLGVPTLVVLAADHGGSDFTERLQAQGYDAGRVSGRGIMARVNGALMARFSLGAPPLKGTPEEANLVGVPDADREMILDAAVLALRAEPEIAAAFSQKELLNTPLMKGASPEELPVKERFAMSVYGGRSPDILATLRPLHTLLPALPGEILASHGSPWNYDRRVPILFWWPGVKPETRFLPVETVDIAPTLAASLDLQPPGDIDGRCLQLPKGSGVRCPPAASGPGTGP